MATLVLSAAGATAGAALGGPAALAGAAAGRIAGAVVGSIIDQRLFGASVGSRDTPVASRMNIMRAREGEALQRVFGRMRVAGSVIWSTRFRTQTNRSGSGVKGNAPRSASASETVYSVSFALALCEGPIDRIGSVWADGALLSMSGISYRLHRGEEGQAPDPLIETVEGSAPGYRGVAYIVFEDLDLTPFGDRIPQFNVEVYRQPKVHADDAAVVGTPLRELVTAVALSPGSGEFALETVGVRRRLRPGVSTSENVNSHEDRADLLVSLDQLEEEAPNCRAVSLVVTWFGDDLRCGRCAIRPLVEERDKDTEPVSWSVAGLDRSVAQVVGRDDNGRPVFGGTPSDSGVLGAIREMRARGLEVMFYPFILMDIPPDSGKPSPWNESGQPAFPWRGRISLDIAPGRPGSVDQTAEAAEDVARFFGAAQVSDFYLDGESVRYAGPDEWSLRRFVLHYAHLCLAAGGVDRFCIGSELRSLTQIRSSRTSFPVVEALRTLAQDVRVVLGEQTKITYAADWSEYFGYHPQDGSGDVFFHLDPLWADPAIDFIGIDNYAPLADWRDGGDHLDFAEGRSQYALSYLQSNIEGGEGFDWYYADEADRAAQRRSPIMDGAYAEPWVFRYKDLRNWWRRPHHNRIDGVRSEIPTPWRSELKPICFTEVGCGAIDKGANQPNVFLDPKSSESCAPHFSSEARDDEIQRRALQAVLSYWRDSARNPTSSVYGGRMIDEAPYVWTWDTRPWPDFPTREAVWSDGVNHARGHWITGRLGSCDLAALVAEICRDAGIEEVDVADLHGTVPGYLVEEVIPARDALRPLLQSFDIDVTERSGVLVFSNTRRGAPVDVTDHLAVADPTSPIATFTRAPDAGRVDYLRLGYRSATDAYEPAIAQAMSEPRGRKVALIECPLALTRGAAADIVERWAERAASWPEDVSFALPPSLSQIEPGDVVRIRDRQVKVERVLDHGLRQITGKTAPSTPAVHVREWGRERPHPPELPLRQPLEAVIFDAPAHRDHAARHQPWVAAFADPWPGRAALVVAREGSPFGEPQYLSQPATMGVTTSSLANACANRTAFQTLDVELFGGLLQSVSRRSLLDGENLAVLIDENGCAELFQFQDAELIGERTYRLRHLLRGQAGASAAASVETPSGVRFILLDRAVKALEISLQTTGAPLRVRIGPASSPVDHETYREIAFTPASSGMSALKPAHLSVERNGEGWRASWMRCSRWDVDQWTTVDASSEQGAQRFLVAISDENGVCAMQREMTESWFQLTDEEALSLGVAAPFTVSVSQISDFAGPGPEARMTVYG